MLPRFQIGELPFQTSPTKGPTKIAKQICRQNLGVQRQCGLNSLKWAVIILHILEMSYI